MAYKTGRQLQEKKELAKTGGNQNNMVSAIMSMKNQVEIALPKHLDAGRFLRVVLTEIRKTPKLTMCNRESFLGAMVQCAQLGLEPGAGLGHAYLIPYNKECQLIIGYQGMIDLVERDGRITIEAHVVYEKDEFEFELGIESKIHHKPYFGSENPGEVVAAYAIARYKDGRYKFRVISKSEIEKAKESSMGKNRSDSPWKKNYDEMARKTAIRRLFKMVPKSPEMARVQELEDAYEIGESQQLEDVININDENLTENVIDDFVEENQEEK